MNFKTYSELDVNQRAILQESSLMKRVSDHYLRNPSAIAFFLEYLGPEFADRSLLMYDGNTPVIVIPALCRKGELNFAGLPTEMVSVLNNDDCRRAVPALVNRLKKITKSDGSLKVTLKPNPALVKEMHPFISEVKAERLGRINLDLSEDTRWSCLRKSYRSLINWGRRNLKVQVIDQDDIDHSAFLAFKGLHLTASGRKTRSDGSWDCQFDMIQRGKGFLVNAYYQNDLVSGCFVMNDQRTALYAVAASNRDLMANGLAVNHFPLWQAICTSRDKGCKEFILGDVVGLNEQEKKMQNIALFKRGFATDIDISSTVICIVDG